MNVARLPVDISNENGSETDGVIDAAEPEVHNTSLVGCVSANQDIGEILSYFVRSVVVHDLLNLTIVASGKLEKLGHGDIQVNAHSTNNASCADRSVHNQLRTDHIDFLANVNVDIVRAETNAIRVLAVEVLASFVVAEIDVSVAGRRDIDLLNSAAMNQGEHLGRGCPG